MSLEATEGRGGLQHQHQQGGTGSSAEAASAEATDLLEKSEGKFHGGALAGLNGLSFIGASPGERLSECPPLEEGGPPLNPLDFGACSFPDEPRDEDAADSAAAAWEALGATAVSASAFEKRYHCSTTAVARVCPFVCMLLLQSVLEAVEKCLRTKAAAGSAGEQLVPRGEGGSAAKRQPEDSDGLSNATLGRDKGADGGAAEDASYPVASAEEECLSCSDSSWGTVARSRRPRGTASREHSELAATSERRDHVEGSSEKDSEKDSEEDCEGDSETDSEKWSEGDGVASEQQRKGQHLADCGESDDTDTQQFARRLREQAQETTMQQTQEGGACVSLPGGFRVPKAVHENLLAHQQEGLLWLLQLFEKQRGGLLGDDMGLGKTVQMAAFIATLHCSGILQSVWPFQERRQQLLNSDSSRASSGNTPPSTDPSCTDAAGEGGVLLVSPATVLRQWLRELHVWCPPVRVCVFHDKELKSLKAAATAASHSNGVLLTTYETLRRHHSLLQSFTWKMLVLDEGQKIKNPHAEITLAVKRFQTPHRYLLSATPVQNNLDEFWSLVDFIAPGRLATLPVFQKELADPIRAGSLYGVETAASTRAAQCSRLLQHLVASLLLRRKKADCLHTLNLPAKREEVLFCALTPVQYRIYKDILDSLGGFSQQQHHHSHEGRHSRRMQRRHKAFAALAVLRKVCNHPDLVLLQEKQQHREQQQLLRPTGLPRKRKRMQELLQQQQEKQHEQQEEGTVPPLWAPNALPSDLGSPSRSGKLRVLLAMVKTWAVEGHKALVFAQTLQTLDLIAAALSRIALDRADSAAASSEGGNVSSSAPASTDTSNVGKGGGGKFAEGSKRPLEKQRKERLQFLRLDGSTPIAKRHRIINLFQTNPRISVLLATTRVGGVGLNLTSADRVVLFEPDWNPMTDAQARERSWRWGQSRPVFVYRLLTAGTLEAKIYQRQLFKMFLSSRVLDSNKRRSTFKYSHRIRSSYMHAVAAAEVEELKELAGNSNRSSGSSQKGEASTKGAELGETILLQSLFDQQGVQHALNHDALEQPLEGRGEKESRAVGSNVDRQEGHGGATSLGCLLEIVCKASTVESSFRESDASQQQLGNPCRPQTATRKRGKKSHVKRPSNAVLFIGVRGYTYTHICWMYRRRECRMWGDSLSPGGQASCRNAGVQLLLAALLCFLPGMLPRCVPLQASDTVPVPIKREEMDLAESLLAFLQSKRAEAFVATTGEILESFADKVPDHCKTLFKAILKQLCVLRRSEDPEREPSFWQLREEFRV
ncbi:DNA repair and recombination protein RAD26 [Cyclospora cayetanensis]|uniref:DNA repair and recombination protein RAD26 n=1 Tax=Cyclospora cayetanensis TaxID=88456 RepID=A0A6P6RYU2_9EIME|nr:DNA repair and recombination protein RAD26 [Cyclospora cayetanensis]